MTLLTARARTAKTACISQPFFVMLALFLSLSSARATPANKSALEKHFGSFLTKQLNRCTTCHLPSDKKAPGTLEEFPHNPFGDRLRTVRTEGTSSGQKRDITAALALVAQEDADHDGVANEIEMLLGRNPGDAKDTPDKLELQDAPAKQKEFTSFLASYRWEPFKPVHRPGVPQVKNRRWARNPIDAFLAAEHASHNLRPRTEASKETLLRRVYLDLIGLVPTPDEQSAFLADPSSNAYEKIVDRLLADPRHGERWGRHWMDVWRYSDWAGWTDGGQVRDSKPHIWRWRDWVVESLNEDKPYDRMILEMLAADELAPEDTSALRATGFLVRNYKMLSREQWLEDTVKHTSQAFLGLTVGCAKCHDHMVDPVSQKEYYRMRAIFEPHQVRTDKVPGQTNTTLDGLVRVYDTGSNPPTWLFHRGDERHPETNKVIAPGVPAFLGGTFDPAEISLPRFASAPDKRSFVIHDTIAASEQALTEARVNLAKLQTNPATTPDKLIQQELTVASAEARHDSLLAVLRAEQLEEQSGKDSAAWQSAATKATDLQRQLSIADSKLKLHSARLSLEAAQAKADEAASKTNGHDKAAKELETAKKKMEEAGKTLAAAEKALLADPDTDFKPRRIETFPVSSTGRRLAFARWVANSTNPLTARVAMNHIWLRHFGRGLVPTPADFGRNGRPPSHPQLLDWLASEFASCNWSMKAMHRLMVTSSTYRQSSTPDESSAKIDPDNVYLWRMNSRRLEAEAVRDNLLYVSGSLDLTMGGPDIDHKLGLSSRRRSIYLRLAAEKEVEFLKIFDGPSVTECYERKPSVVPQQALALANSEMALIQARALARSVVSESGEHSASFASLAYRKVLARSPTKEELRLCVEFLSSRLQTVSRGSESETTPLNPVQRARENLMLVLMNHNDFVTVR